MAGSRKKGAPFPTREQILAFLKESPGRAGAREIARAFRVEAGREGELRDLLREIERDGGLEGGQEARRGRPGRLPAVAVVEVIGVDVDGEVLARPAAWKSPAAPPSIYMAPERRGHPALGAGDRVLARLNLVGREEYEGRTIRRLAEAPPLVLGVFRADGRGGRIRPTTRGARQELAVHAADAKGAESGELVRAEVLPGRRLGLREARVVERLGRPEGPRLVSVISIHDHGIPTEFAAEALALADAAGPVPAAGREDLRRLPLVTIDGEDARDFDDAVFAEPDGQADDGGGWHLIVGIADVAWYVRTGDALDRAARERGNSVYFPDRVVPMLPEALSNGWCSLVPEEDRGCLAAHLWIDREGNLTRHRFARALMRSHARLTYEQVQAEREGRGTGVSRALAADAIAPLYGAYGALARARRRRGVLELDLPERRVQVDGEGRVTGVGLRPRYDSHRLIEEFMIAANVAAAETIERLRQPCLYRVHDQPPKEKLDSLRDFLASLGLRLAPGSVVRPSQINGLLQRAAGTPHAALVNEVVLRSQALAQYSPDNIGHFGLALRRYCHFTSPIRRYADLLVHRALIAGLGAGAGGLPPGAEDFEALGRQLSAAERRAQEAERDAVDRFTALWLEDRVGAQFRGRIGGVTRFGLFVTLEGVGADGLVPLRSLPADHYVHDESRHRLKGARTGVAYRMGEEVDVRLVEADGLTGSLLLEIADRPARRPRGPRPTPGKRRRARK